MVDYCPNCEGPLIGVVDVSGLSERHQAALVLFVQKFKAGAKEHGDLVKDKDWTMDILMEDVDGAFYRIFKLLDKTELPK